MNFLPGRFSMGRKVFRGKFYSGGICQNFYLKFVYLSYFLFADSVLRLEMLRVIVQVFTWIELFKEFFLRGEARFSEIIKKPSEVQF